MRPGIVESSGMQQLPGKEAQQIESGVQSPEIISTPIQMPETRRRGIFKRR